MWTEVPEPQWRARQILHQQRVDAWVQPLLDRRSRGIKHPVEDFLFTYYSFRPAALRRWHPGIGVAASGEGAYEVARVKGYVFADGLAFVDPAITAERRDRVSWIRNLLGAIASRPPLVGCFGLHEWAMVYQARDGELRHAARRLRLGQAGTDEVVETHRIACSHFDAFRFFTESARSLNVIQPNRAEQPRNEQPGCLHVAMDCYKWAYTLAPFASAELVADCFELAREVRQVDMRASPYDLSDLGVTPIRIETAAGKAEYVAAQRAFAQRSVDLRRRLIAVCDEALNPSPCPPLPEA
ncbi:MAG: 3-methyladenine DNA glycosylase [Nocardioidaceae bacterium]|nr:3-methyladenine DNA glycosylase [Nocardioidaceae bacterium]